MYFPGPWTFDIIWFRTDVVYPPPIFAISFIILLVSTGFRVFHSASMGMENSVVYSLAGLLAIYLRSGYGIERGLTGVPVKLDIASECSCLCNA